MKPSMREALAPVFNARPRQPLRLLSGDYPEDLVARVTALLADHPGASANAVAAAVGGRRQNVLAIVRALRGGSPRFPRPEDSTSEDAS
jgi:hypothetical protein